MRNGAKKLRIWPRATWQNLSQARWFPRALFPSTDIRSSRLGSPHHNVGHPSKRKLRRDTPLPKLLIGSAVDGYVLCHSGVLPPALLTMADRKVRTTKQAAG